MSKRSVNLLIDDILEAIGKIRNYTADMKHEDFVSSGMAADAVVRNLEIIGEAANRLPDTFTACAPGNRMAQGHRAQTPNRA